MSLFYEEARSFIKRRAVGSVGPVVSRTEATPRWAGSAMGLQPSMFTGILWVLRTGARWRDLPEGYPDGSTCWRRLRMWEEQGVWLRVWRKLLAQMDERGLLDWEG